MHVGTRDPIDRVRPSGERLLSQAHEAGRKGKQDEDPCRPVATMRDRSNDRAQRDGTGTDSDG